MFGEIFQEMNINKKNIVSRSNDLFLSHGIVICAFMPFRDDVNAKKCKHGILGWPESGSTDNLTFLLSRQEPFY